MSWSAMGARKEDELECDWRSQILQQELRIEQLVKKVEVHKVAAEELATQRERELEQEKVKAHRLKQEADDLRTELEVARTEIYGTKDDFGVFQERLELAEKACRRIADEKREIVDAVRAAYERSSNAEKKIDEISSLLLASERASLQLSSDKATLDAKLQASESRVRALECSKSELIEKMSKLEHEKDTERSSKLKIQDVRDRMVKDLDMMKRLVAETREENAHLQQKLMLADLNLKKVLGTERCHPRCKIPELDNSTPGRVRVTLELVEEESLLPAGVQPVRPKKRQLQVEGGTATAASRVFTVEELFASLGRN